MFWKKTLLYFIWQNLRYHGLSKGFFNTQRYYSRWKKSFQPGRNSVADEQPWINFPALDFLSNHMRKDFKVFEFGGGGSTLFFCQTAGEVVTVEDHAEWFQTLSDTISRKGFAHWKGFFIAPEPDSGVGSHLDPAEFRSGAKGLENFRFERYARSIDPFPERYFDLILVDGRARPSCIRQAIPKLKSGGYLVVDNTERKYYLAPFQNLLNRDFEQMVETRAPVAYTPDFTITSIYRKK